MTISLEDPLLTPSEVAAILGRTESALAMLRHRGTGPKFTKTASRIRYRRSSLEAWLVENERDRT